MFEVQLNTYFSINQYQLRTDTSRVCRLQDLLLSFVLHRWLMYARLGGGPKLGPNRITISVLT